MLTWPYWLILILVVVPGMTWALAPRFPRSVFGAGVALIGFGCLDWLILGLASEMKWPPINYPDWWFVAGLLSLFFGMSTFMGYGIWKVTSRPKGPNE
jgi:hypothetical protein